MNAYEQLRNSTDDELIGHYNREAAHAIPGLSFLRDELARRDSARREERLLRYTKEIRSLTVAVAAATIIALAIAVAALVSKP